MGKLQKSTTATKRGAKDRRNAIQIAKVAEIFAFHLFAFSSNSSEYTYHNSCKKKVAEQLSASIRACMLVCLTVWPDVMHGLFST